MMIFTPPQKKQRPLWWEVAGAQQLRTQGFVRILHALSLNTDEQRARRGGRDLLQVGRQHDHRHEHGPLLDLAAEAEDGVLLEALPDVEDVLVLERDEADLLQSPHTGLLDELHHRLRGREGAKGEEFKLWNPADSSCVCITATRVSCSSRRI